MVVDHKAATSLAAFDPMPGTLPIPVIVTIHTADVYSSHTPLGVLPDLDRSAPAPEDLAVDVLARWGEEPRTLLEVIQQRIESAVTHGMARGPGAGAPSELMGHAVTDEFRRMREEGLIVAGSWKAQERSVMHPGAGPGYRISPTPELHIEVDVPPSAWARARERGGGRRR